MQRAIGASCLSAMLLVVSACSGHQDGSINPTVQGGTASISATAPSTQVIVPSASQTARLKEINRLYTTTPTSVSGVPLASGVPFKVALSSNGQMLAVGYTGGQLVVWDLDNAGRPAMVLRNAVTTTPPDRGLTISNDGRLLATAYTEDAISVWNVSQQVPLANFTATNATSSLKFSADGTQLLAAGFSLDTFDMATGHPTTSSPSVPPGGLTEAADANFGPGGLSVVAVFDKYFAVWNRGSTPPQLVETDLSGLAVSPDGTEFVAAGGGEISVWDVKGRREIASWHASIKVLAATFLGNDQRVALGGSTSSGVPAVEVFGVSTEHLVTQYRGTGKGIVDGITYDPHGLILAKSQGQHEYPQQVLDIFAAPS